MKSTKEIPRHASLYAWGPGNRIATGTSAQTIEDDFSFSQARLEVWKVDFSDKSETALEAGNCVARNRFRSLAWSSNRGDFAKFPNGLIAGGLIDGCIQIWDPSSMEKELCTIEIGQGPITCVEFSTDSSMPMLVQCGEDGSWHLWNLSNPAKPVEVPTGAKAHTEKLVSVKFNKKAPHIVGVAGGDSVTVWDLRAKGLVMTFKTKETIAALEWSPDSPAELCLGTEASGQGQGSVQIWDLKKPHSATRVMIDQQSQGVARLSWSPMDSGLLASCSSDGRVLCWNPATGEKSSELAQEVQSWVYDVQFSSEIPSVLAIGGYTASKINVVSLKTPQKWLRPTAGVAWGFGGRMFSFGPENELRVEKVEPEKGLAERAGRLEAAVEGDSGSITQFCQEKMEQSEGDGLEQWKLLHAASKVDNPRTALLAVLGFEAEAIAQEAEGQAGKKDPEDYEGLVRRLMTVGNLKGAVDVAIQANRLDDALVIASLGPAELNQRALSAYFERNSGSPVAKVLEAASKKDLRSFVEQSELKDDKWKQVLSTVCSYAPPTELGELSSIVADRLAGSGEGSKATLAHLFGGNMEALAQSWVKEQREGGAKSEGTARLQEMTEKAIILQKLKEEPITNKDLAAGVNQLASILAAEGLLSSALKTAGMMGQCANEELQGRIMAALAASTDATAQAPANENATQGTDNSQQQVQAVDPWEQQQQQQQREQQEAQAYAAQQQAAQQQAAQQAAAQQAAAQQAAAQQQAHGQHVTPGPAAPVTAAPVAPVAPVPVAPVTHDPAPIQHQAVNTPAPAAPAAPVAPAAPAAPAAPPADIPAEVSDIAANFATAAGKVTDQKKRNAAERDLVKLNDALKSGRLPPQVLALVRTLSEQAANGQSGEAKNTNRTLTDVHWTEWSPFKNIKFLY